MTSVLQKEERIKRSLLTESAKLPETILILDPSPVDGTLEKEALFLVKHGPLPLRAAARRGGWEVRTISAEEL